MKPSSASSLLLLLLLVLSLPPSISPWTSSPVPRTPLFPSVPITSPLLIAALSPSEASSFANTFLQTFATTPIPCQLKTPAGVALTITPLSDFLSLAMSSTHDRAAFCFAEGLLVSTPLGAAMTALRESICDLISRDPDLFTHFPVAVRPSDCVVLAGAGTTSTLHCDPFEWLGTSLCLEGVKVWRFVERGEVIDGLLEGERVDSVTWGGEDDKEVCLSAGWQSEKSLFKHLNGHLNEPVPSARELSEMDVADKVALMSLIAADPTCLVPDVALPPRTSVLTAIQRPGDLLLIPRNYWHQTYALEPSLAVASQRCGKAELWAVIDHVTERAGVEVARVDGEDGATTVGRMFEEIEKKYS